MGSRLVDFAARLGAVPVVAATVGVKRSKQPVTRDHFAYPPETARGTLFLDKEHRVMLVGRVIHRDDQIPQCLHYPPVAAAVLVHHHPGKGRAFATLPVGPAPGTALDQPLGLKLLLDPAIAASALVLAPVPAVKVAHVPARVARAVQLRQRHHLVNRRSAMRHLP